MTSEKQVRFAIPEGMNEDFPDDYSGMEEHLRKLFKEKSMGMDTINMQLLDALQEKSFSKQQLFNLVKSLSLFVTSMDHKVQPLVNAVLNINWLNQSVDFIKAYLHLLQNIVSAQASYVVPVCKMLLQNIINAPQKYPDIPNIVLFEQLHAAIAKILNLIPTGPSCLLPLISQYVPHKTADQMVITFYVKSMLYIASYAPILQSEIVSIVIDCIVQLDVDINIELMEEEGPEEDIFEMDDMENSVIAGDIENDSDTESLIVIQSDQRKMIFKLDAVLEIVFEHIKNLYEKGKNQNDFNEFNGFFYSLLDSFDRIMLPTHKLKCVQFLIFYICSLEPGTFPEEFMGLLVTRMMNVSDSSVIRMYAASYLGSYIARAKYVDLTLVKYSLKIMNQLVNGFVQSFEKDISGRLESERYGVLYATVQAILYIYCFRWKQLMAVDGKLNTEHFPAELRGFQAILYSKFQPLRVCNQAIVDEFARITHHLNIIYCYPLINPPLRSNTIELILPIDGVTGKRSRIDAYFPFDPMLIPKSRRFISEIFQEWDGGEDDVSEHNMTNSDISSSLHAMSLDDRKISMSLSFTSLNSGIS